MQIGHHAIELDDTVFMVALFHVALFERCLMRDGQLSFQRNDILGVDQIGGHVQQTVAQLEKTVDVSDVLRTNGFRQWIVTEVVISFRQKKARLLNQK